MSERNFMKNIKWIVTESFQGRSNLEEIFASLYLSERGKMVGLKLTKEKKLDIIKQIEHSQGSLCSMKGERNGTNGN